MEFGTCIAMAKKVVVYLQKGVRSFSDRGLALPLAVGLYSSAGTVFSQELPHITGKCEAPLIPSSWLGEPA